MLFSWNVPWHYFWNVLILGVGPRSAIRLQRTASNTDGAVSFLSTQPLGYNLVNSALKIYCEIMTYKMPPPFYTSLILFSMPKNLQWNLLTKIICDQHDNLPARCWRATDNNDYCAKISYGVAKCGIRKHLLLCSIEKPAVCWYIKVEIRTGYIPT